MKKLVIILLILVLSSSDVNSQEIWRFNTNNHSFDVIIDTIRLTESTDYYDLSVTKIEIYDRSINALVQTIETNKFRHESFLDSTMVFIIEDMNFDGYPDIRLLSWVSTSFYTSYQYWFYDSKYGLFVRDTTFEKFINPYFDPEKETFHTYWRYGFNEFGHAIYEWRNNKLELIVKEIESWGPEDGVPGTLVTIRMVNGELKEEEIEVQEYSLHPHEKCDLKK